jgi:hypothetical protein
VGFWDRVRSLWTQESGHYVHGWVQSWPPAEAVEPGAGRHYLQVRLTGMSLRFSRERAAGRSPVLQSEIRWPVGGQWITVAQTVDRTRFTQAGDEDAPDFAVYQVSDLALSGELPLNGGDVEVTVALLSAPGSSVLDRATSFLNDIASLTLVPQLTAAAPVAAKVAGGVDALLGNEEVSGVLAFCTSVPADAPRNGHYLVTDLPTQSGRDLATFAVKDDALLHWSDQAQEWQAATGFSYLLIEFSVEGPKPTRWTELPEITDLSSAALQQLAQASTAADVERAAPQLKLAVVKALYSPDLAHVDRDPAAQALAEQWKAQVARLAEIQATRADSSGRAVAARETSLVPTAERIARELDDEVGSIRVGEVDVAARDVAGAVRGIVSTKQARLTVAGRTSVDAQHVSSTGTVMGIEVT